MFNRLIHTSFGIPAKYLYCLPIEIGHDIIGVCDFAILCYLTAGVFNYYEFMPNKWFVYMSDDTTDVDDLNQFEDDVLQANTYFAWYWIICLTLRVWAHLQSVIHHANGDFDYYASIQQYETRMITWFFNLGATGYYCYWINNHLSQALVQVILISLLALVLDLYDCKVCQARAMEKVEHKIQMALQKNIQERFLKQVSHGGKGVLGNIQQSDKTHDA